ncbi:hypothetical protein [Shewanella nanhaiensis]|uniref:MSHA biogenesis protein MshF n=1 Tax=Shewanella nanhaiensis TaxID=2864872 RepID=A0ABS7DZI7_9GAMM|nr:hypothetical protein [Shewanella nanhaiensis]MBW8182827.1 hypothetical protein [Shewanella nanhaiensis]
MLSQQKADGELLQVLGKVVSLLLILVLLATLAFKYFSSLETVGVQRLKADHTKLINVLGMVKAQWFAQGRPDLMPLDWNSFGIYGQNLTKESELVLIKMSKGGWPLPEQRDKVGCKQLWGQLLGRETERQHIVTSFDSSRDVCNYFDNNSERLSYHLSSGRVIFLTKD